MQGHPNTGIVVKASMETFRWSFQYSAIFMVWCAGYLGRASLVAFLSKAKLQLSQNSNRRSRRDSPDSFIVVLDNVLSDGEEPELIKGQWVRSEQLLESIFAEAGLMKYSRTVRQTMPEPFRDVVAWTLW